MEMIILRSKRRGTGANWIFRPSDTGIDTDIPVSGEVTFSLERADPTPRDAANLHRDPEVVACAPSMPIALIEPLSVASAVSEAAPLTMWGIEAVKAHSSSRTGAGVKVAILDTGIDKTHPAFVGINIESRNFTIDPDEDVNGHGTHCAGTIFGRDVDKRRIGVARGVENILIGKVLGAGGGSSATLVEAVNWAFERRAHIISMSLGIDFVGYRDQLVLGGAPERQATSMALAGYRANVRLFDDLSRLMAQSEAMPTVLLVAAAGNESDRKSKIQITVSPPAAGDGFVSVAALARPPSGSPHDNYEVASFSNIGARVAAPGVDVWSAKVGGGLQALSGTSMATPHVAGVAALWAEDLVRRSRPLNARNLRHEIEKSVLRLDHLSFDDAGIGIVQSPQV